MPTISKIRFTNVIYEKGIKRYNDSTFLYDGHNGAFVLENGGGKTVFIQAALQAILPHGQVGKRTVRKTFSLEGEAMHIAIEWIISEGARRRYAVTATTLYLQDDELKSLKYVYEYGPGDKNSIDNIPFVQTNTDGTTRSASRGEISEYYHQMKNDFMLAKVFLVTKDFHEYIEKHFKIIADEWKSIATINGEEGGVEGFFNGCNTTTQLVEKLLIPTVEQAISGDGKVDFADTFETHREHFKKYQELQKVIAESNLVKEKMSGYVQTMTKLQDKDQSHIKHLQRANAFYHLIQEKRDTLAHTLEEIAAQEDRYQQGLDTIKGREALCKLTELYNFFKQKEEVFRENKQCFEKSKELLAKKKLEYTTLNIAKKQAEINTLEGQIQGLKRKIEVLNEDVSIQDIKDQLEDNGECLKGLYTDRLEKYNRELNILRGQKETQQDKKRTLESQVKILEQTKEQIKDEILKLSTLSEEKQECLWDIEKKILEDAAIQDVKEEKIKWEKKVATNENRNVLLEDRRRKLIQERKQLEEAILKDNEAYQEQIKIESKKKTELGNIEDNQEELVNNLKAYLPNLLNLDRIYTKQEQILGMLHDKEQQLISAKENLFIQERKLSRFLDFYKDHEYFTAEPLVEAWLYKWRNQFEYIIAGATYIENLCGDSELSIEKCYEIYPNWVEVIITTESEIEKLKQKLQQVNKEMTYPVTVLSMTEANQIIKGQEVKENKVYPISWEEQLIQEQFKANLTLSEDKVTPIREKRVQKEVEVNEVSGLKEKLSAFLQKYSYETYTTIEKDLEEVRQNIRIIKDHLQKLKEKKESIDPELEKINTDKDHIQQENGYLNIQIQKAYEYLKIIEIKKRLDEKRRQKEEEKHKIEQSLKITTSDLEDTIDILKECEETISEYKKQQLRIEDNYYYKEVKDCSMRQTNETLESLIAVREVFKSSLDKHQGNRKEVEDSITGKEKQVKRLNEEISRERTINKYNEVIDLFYDSVGAEKLHALSEEIPALESDKDELDERLKIAKEDYDKISTKFEDEKKAYEDSYETILQYIEDIPAEKMALTKEKRQINTRKKELESYKATTTKARATWDDVHKKLELKNERYEFLAPQIIPQVLSQETLTNIDYTVEKVVVELLKELENSLLDKENCKSEVAKMRERFIQFCNTEIKDVKLRSLTYQGINEQKTYPQILEWQTNLESRIGYSIRIAEKAMIEHDRQMNQFIIHLYTHLTNVAMELKQIPKKTQLKTEEGSKEFYEITMPEWKEEEGKIKLRQYIGDITKLIEEKYENQLSGDDEQEEIKKFINNKFRVTQMMNILIGNDKIKVKCRKVIRMGSVTNQKYSWEESNEWSGGEKWSKNMALFMGILNYMAEKKQNVYTTDKISRVVILDNPFGKASSDHVLEPVFFIAQQLGFQVIALTAHAEGEFIRKYFPIVYSCRLRTIKDSSVTIVTSQQEINKAYFREIDAPILLRLGQAEQMTLL